MHTRRLPLGMKADKRVRSRMTFELTKRIPQAARPEPRAAAWRVGLAGCGAAGVVGVATYAAGALGLATAAPALAGWAWYAGPLLKPFMPAIEAVDLGALVHELDPDLTYAPRAYVAEEVYRASGLTHGGYDAYGGGHLIEGVWRGQALRMSKLRLVRRAPDPVQTSLEDDADGPPPGLPRFIPVFHGLFFELALPVPVDGFVVARPRGSGDAAPAEGVAVKLDDIAFDAVYAVHASDPALARAWLTPERRTTLLTMVLGAEKPVELALRGGHAYLAVAGPRAFIESVLVRSEADPPARDLTRRELLAVLAIPSGLALHEAPQALV